MMTKHWITGISFLIILLIILFVWKDIFKFSIMSIQDQILGLQEVIDLLESRITNLEEQIEDLESRISDLELGY